MPQMISIGKEMLRIHSKNPAKLEYSTNDGHTWLTRYNGSSNVGVFSDLMDNGKEILATTSKGLFYSTNNGGTWFLRHR
jgi:hypothetical protein